MRVKAREQIGGSGKDVRDERDKEKKRGTKARGGERKVRMWGLNIEERAMLF